MNSLIHHNLAASFSSSASSLLGQSKFSEIRTLSVMVQGKSCGVGVKCVASPSTEKTAYTTKVSSNENFAKLQAGYLFPENARRRAAHMLKYPDAKVISLGIDDTTEPIPEVITTAMAERAQSLSTVEGYSDYGAEQGEKQLRTAIASTFYSNLGIEEDDIFVSDGAKSDISRLQVLFGSKVTMAVQDPSYPLINGGELKGWHLWRRRKHSFSQPLAIFNKECQLHSPGYMTLDMAMHQPHSCNNILILKITMQQ